MNAAFSSECSMASPARSSPRSAVAARLHRSAGPPQRTPRSRAGSPWQPNMRERVVLQRDRGAEQGHDAIPGELVDRPAAALHHRRAQVKQRSHDLPEPLRAHHRGDVHRVHYVGEKHRHLLVLRRLGGVCDWRAALTAELVCCAQLCATRSAREARGRRCAAAVPAVIHVNMVSPLVKHVCHIATDPSSPDRGAAVGCTHDLHPHGRLVEAGDPVQLSSIRTTNAGQGFQGFWRPTA